MEELNKIQIEIQNIINLVQLHHGVDDTDIKDQLKKAAMSALKDLNKE